MYNELLFRSERFPRLKKYNANILDRDRFTVRIASIRYVCWYFRPAVIVGLTDRVVRKLGLFVQFC